MRGRFDRATGKFSIDRAAKTASVELEIPTATVNSGDTDKRPAAAHARRASEERRFLQRAGIPDHDLQVDQGGVQGRRAGGRRRQPDDARRHQAGDAATSSAGSAAPTCRTQGKRYQCGGNATGSFKRSDFGMKFGLPTAIGDEVKLWMSFYGFKQ